MTECQSSSIYVRNEYVLDLFLKYSESGDKPTLQRLFDFMTNEKRSIPVPPELVLSVSIYILNSIEIESINYLNWQFLGLLMNSYFNLYANNYLLLLQNSPILPRLLRILVDNLKTTFLLVDYMIYMEVLNHLVSDSYERQSILFNQEDQHALKVVANFYQNKLFLCHETNEFFIVDSLSLISNLAYIYPEAIEQNDQRSIRWFLNIEGMSILSKLFMMFISIQDIQMRSLSKLLDGIFKVYTSLCQLNTTCLDSELYCIDRNSAYRMNVAFYKVFTEDMGITDFTALFNAFVGYTTYLQKNCLDSDLKSLLLYKPPGKDAKSALAVIVLKCVRNTNFTNSTAWEVDFITYCGQWSSQFPAVAALLDEPLRELPPDRDDKVRVCAYPGCNIDGKGLFSKMLKCGRCRSVYYCEENHQREHWKVHKQSCCKLTTTTITTTT